MTQPLQLPKIIHRNFKSGLKCDKCSSFNLEALSSSLAVCLDCRYIDNLERLLRHYFTMLTLCNRPLTLKKKEIHQEIGVQLTSYTLQKYINLLFSKKSKHAQYYTYKL